MEGYAMPVCGKITNHQEAEYQHFDIDNNAEMNVAPPEELCRFCVSDTESL